MARKPSMVDLDPKTRRTIEEATITGDSSVPILANPLRPSSGPIQTVDPGKSSAESGTMADFIQQAVGLGLDPVRVSAAFESANGNEQVAATEFQKIQAEMKAAQDLKDQSLTGTMTDDSQGTPIVVNGEEQAGGAITERVREAVKDEKDASPVVNPFGINRVITGAVAKAEDRIAAVDDATTNANVTLSRIQEARLAREQKKAEELRIINDEEEAAIEDLQSRMKPIQGKISGLEKRRSDIAANGRSFIQKIKGILDPNWNPEALDQRIDKLRGVTQDLVDSYAQGSMVRGADWDNLLKDAAIEEGVEKVEEGIATEKISMATRALAAAQTKIGFIGDVLSLNSQVAAAQSQTRAEKVSNATIQELTKWMGEAKESGGRVVVDGVEISQEMIRGRIQNLEQEDLSFRSAEMAVEAGEMNLAAAHQNKMIAAMTPEQLLQAKQNGYKHRGMSLNPTDVETALFNGLSARDAATGAAMNQTREGQAQQALSSFGQNLNQIYQRARSVLGGADTPELTQVMREIADGMSQTAEEFKAAGSKGNAQSVANVTMQRLAQYQQKLTGSIGAIATRMAGGDKDGAYFMEKYLRGQQMTQDDAFAFAKKYAGKEPPVAMRGSAATQRVTSAYAAAEASVNNDPDSKKLSAGERQKLIRQQFESTLKASATSEYSDHFFKALPTIAERTGHEFKGIRQASWNQAIAGSIAPAAQKLSALTGIPLGEAEQLVRLGRRHEKVTPQVEQQVSTTRFASMLDLLDASPDAASMKMSPSESLIDFLNAPRTSTSLLNYNNNMMKDFGGQLVASSVGSGVVRTMSGIAQNFAIANQNRIATKVGGTFTGGNRYQTDGTYKVKAVLGSIAGISQDEETLLLKGLTLQAQAQGIRVGSTPARTSPSGQATLANAEFGALERILMNHKFEDPNLERLRKLAAPKFREASEGLDRAVARLSESE